MKVYIVESRDSEWYDGYHYICAVFSTKEKAEQYIKENTVKKPEYATSQFESDFDDAYYSAYDEDDERQACIDRMNKKGYNITSDIYEEYVKYLESLFVDEYFEIKEREVL